MANSGWAAKPCEHRLRPRPPFAKLALLFRTREPTANRGWQLSRRAISTISSLCTAANVPATTALRWISEMTGMGILVREQDEEDKGPAFISLSGDAATAMARFFDELGSDAARMI